MYFSLFLVTNGTANYKIPWACLNVMLYRYLKYLIFRWKRQMWWRHWSRRWRGWRWSNIVKRAEKQPFPEVRTVLNLIFFKPAFVSNNPVWNTVVANLYSWAHLLDVFYNAYVDYAMICIKTLKCNTQYLYFYWNYNYNTSIIIEKDWLNGLEYWKL